MKPPRRIETRASRTADLTCCCRAISFYEKNFFYKSEDWIAPKLLPRNIQVLLKLPFAGRLLSHVFGPEGLYEWVIARTKYIDKIFTSISPAQFDQVLILGAGFDSRSIRFHKQLASLPVFELDAGNTQMIKNRQFRARGIHFPDNLSLVSINFELESISDKLSKSGFQPDKKTLVLMEGVLQYLKEENVRSLLTALQSLLCTGSRLICDFAHQKTFQANSNHYRQAGLIKKLDRFGESWKFKLEENQVIPFFAEFGFKVIDLQTPEKLEKHYFTNSQGKLIARINDMQSIISAEKEEGR